MPNYGTGNTHQTLPHHGWAWLRPGPWGFIPVVWLLCPQAQQGVPPMAVFVSEYLRDRRIRVRIGTTVSDGFYPEEGVPTGGVLAVTYFGMKINELPSCIAKDIFKALFVDDLAICSRGRSLDTIKRHLEQAVNAMQEWATRNGFRFAARKCKVIHFTAPLSRAQRPPLWGLETHVCLLWRNVD